MHDAGRIINPTIADGQVMGAIAHGIGNALYESMGYDEDGQPLITTLADYLLVTASEMPMLDEASSRSGSPVGLRTRPKLSSLAATAASQERAAWRRPVARHDAKMRPVF